MSTLKTLKVLEVILRRYGWLMEDNFLEFMVSILVDIDDKSHLPGGCFNEMAELIYDVMIDGDYSDENKEMFLEFIERNEVNVRNPYIPK